MVFEVLNDAANRYELLLVHGGLCHYHLRRDGILTIREILVLPGQRGQGIGSGLLVKLAAVPGAVALLARCPADLPSNHFWENRGFRKVAEEWTKSNRRIIVWRLELNLSTVPPAILASLPVR